jgi:hypothetical protein
MTVPAGSTQLASLCTTRNHDHITASTAFTNGILNLTKPPGTKDSFATPELVTTRPICLTHRLWSMGSRALGRLYLNPWHWSSPAVFSSLALQEQYTVNPLDHSCVASYLLFFFSSGGARVLGSHLASLPGTSLTCWLPPPQVVVQGFQGP